MNKKNSSFTFDALFANRRFTAVVSLILAVLTWMIVVTVIDPESSGKLSVPVDFAYNEAAYANLGLSIVEKPSKNITVYFKGDGSVLGSLAQNDILVYPDYSTVKDAGTYTLRLEIKNAGNKKFEVTGPKDVYVNVTFDKVVTQKYTVAVNATGIQPADGYYMDLPVLSVPEVTLTGPEQTMSRVTKVVANVELKEERTESALVTAKLQYQDADGTPVIDDDIKADIQQVEVTIPIYKIKELPLTLEYTSIPAGYDPAVLGAKLSETTIRVAGPPAVLDTLTSISAGIVDLAAFQLDAEAQLNIELPEGLRNVDSLQTVGVTFDTEGYEARTVTVTEVRAINVPEGVTITFPSERINSVTLIGKTEELDALTDTGIVAQVDASASNLSVSKGQQNIAAQIVIPSTKTVFATGKYTILCNVETQNMTASSTAGAAS